MCIGYEAINFHLRGNYGGLWQAAKDKYYITPESLLLEKENRCNGKFFFRSKREKDIITDYINMVNVKDICDKYKISSSRFYQIRKRFIDTNKKLMARHRR